MKKKRKGGNRFYENALNSRTYVYSFQNHNNLENNQFIGKGGEKKDAEKENQMK